MFFIKENRQYSLPKMNTPHNEELREEWNKYIDERQGFYDYGSKSNEAIGIADWWLSHFETERTTLIEEIKDKITDLPFISSDHEQASDTILDILSHLESDNQKTQ